MLQRIWLGTLQNTQFVVTSLTAIFILRIRTVHSIYFGAGTLVAAFTAKLLKKCIRQPRPTGAKKFQKTYGMPSTHSSSIAFFGVYLSLASLFLPLHPRLTSLLPLYDNYITSPKPYSSIEFNESSDLFHSISPVETFVRIGLASFFILTSSSVCWSRVRLGHHTKRQVVVGASLGGTIAFGWLTLWLGLEGWSQILGFDVVRKVEEMVGSSGWVQKIPEVVIEGLKVPGQVVQKLAEEVGLNLVEAWKVRQFEGCWDLLRSLSYSKIVHGEL